MKITPPTNRLQDYHTYDGSRKPSKRLRRLRSAVVPASNASVVAVLTLALITPFLFLSQTRAQTPLRQTKSKVQDNPFANPTTAPAVDLPPKNRVSELPEVSRDSTPPEKQLPPNASEQTTNLPASKDQQVGLTQKDIDAQLKQINDATTLDETTKAEAQKRLQSATEWLKTGSEAEQKTKRYQAEIDGAPVELQDAKSKLAAPLGTPQFNLPPGVTLPQIEQFATDTQTRLNQARETFAKREESLKRRNDRKTELGKLLAETNQRLDDAKKQSPPSPKGESSLAEMARRTESEARLYALERQKALYQVEAQRLDALAELLPLRRDLAKREVAFLEKESAGWKRVAADFRKLDSVRQAAEANRQVKEAHPVVKKLAQTNSKLAERRKALATSIEEIQSEVKQSKKTAKKLGDDFDKLTEKVDKVGNSTSIGVLLRRERDLLPNVRTCQDRVRFVRDEMPQIHLALLDLQDQRELLSDPEAALLRVVLELETSAQRFDRQELKQMVRELLLTKRELLDKLIRDYDEYIKLLGDLELTEKELIGTTDKLSTFIDERVLWIRSSEPIGRSDMPAAWTGLQEISRPGAWLDTFGVVVKRAIQQPLLAILTLTTVILMLVFRDRFRRQFNSLCRVETDELNRKFWPTFQAIGAAAIATAVLPGLMWLTGWLLSGDAMMPELARAVGVGLQSAAFVFWLCQLTRQLSLSDGVLVRHFEWHGTSVAILRRHLAWLTMLGVPVVFFVATVNVFRDGQWVSSLGRFAFISGSIGLAIFAHCVLRADRGMNRQPSGDTWIYRLRHLIYFAGVSCPLALAVLSALGYDYSALKLASRLQATAAVLLATLLSHAVALRWLATRRCIEPDAPEASQTSGNREAGDASVNMGISQPDPLNTTAASDEAITPPNTIDDASDQAQADEQVRYLLRYAVAAALFIGGYVIWSDATPALSVFDRVVLWSKNIEVREQVEDAEGKPVTRRSEKTVATTLKHALIAGVLFALGLVLARNLPGLLQLLLERTPTDKGQRYAAGLILRYSVTMAGMLMACRTLGLTWVSIQWLAAAMTVGLGFGLQEIFANLVSGLIILFERPIRIGDLVTVGGVSGRVTRMQIRATTITDFDRRELIVPNKKFITEDVMNWTLSDNVNRIVIEVGIAYGSDTALARELLLNVAHQHPLILDDPEPIATFDRFAESSLNFTLRCFLPNLDNRLATINELHAAIDNEFRRANIEIAFPQRDLHVRYVAAELPSAVSNTQTTKDAA